MKISSVINIAETQRVQEGALTHSEPKSVKVKSIKFHSIQDVYNMEVENHHNYSVDGGLIIHNCVDSSRYAFERDMKRPSISVLK